MDATFDYLTIGHISRDIVPDDDGSPSGRYAVGGTVAFSAEMAYALGCRTAVLTSAAADIDVATAIPDATVAVVPAEQTTTFQNIYQPEQRIQYVHQVAAWLSADHLPSAWRSTPIVHLGPITPQVDPQLVTAFPDSVIGLTPQGWMRDWDSDGRVRPVGMRHADILLPAADAVVIGEEDLCDAAELENIRSRSKLLVMTRGARGCIIFSGDEQYEVPAPTVVEVNATGAGDIFATAFFVQLWRSQHNILDSAEFANKIASAAVTQPDLPAKVALVNKLMAEVA